MYLKHRFTLLFCLLISALTAQQAAPFERYRPKIDSLLMALTKAQKPGLAVGIIQAGKTVYSKGFGQANLENPLLFKPSTISDIGSLAKQITCYAIVLLAQQQKLSLDDDIRQHLPEVPDFGHTIRIRHLMNHTSGIREIYSMLAIAGWKQGDAIRQQDALALVKKSSGLNFVPGSQYAYCNTGYMLLAEIIQKVSGQKFETWMQENIFTPLQMNQTYVMDQQGELFPDCADSYTLQNKVWLKQYDNSTVIGAGGIYTTLHDLARWANHLRSLKTGGAAAFQALFQKAQLNDGREITYALGLQITNYRGLPVIQHTGSSAGYRAALLYFPQQDWIIFLKGNYAQLNSQSTAEAIADILLAKQLEPEPLEMTTRTQSTLRGRTLSKPLSDYAGLYYCPDIETTYTLQADEGKLIAHQRSNGRLELRPIEGAEDWFEEAAVLGKVSFERNAQGKVIGLSIDNGELLNLKFLRLLE
jgi:CubicO group peptidase (beta-lactamase class C family)